MVLFSQPADVFDLLCWQQNDSHMSVWHINFSVKIPQTGRLAYEGNETGQENQIYANGIAECPCGINAAKTHFKNNH
jgi:hypothetical protein